MFPGEDEVASINEATRYCYALFVTGRIKEKNMKQIVAAVVFAINPKPDDDIAGNQPQWLLCFLFVYLVRFGVWSILLP